MVLLKFFEGVITIKVLDIYKEIIIDSNSRFKSWEHCYLFFKENRKKDVPVSDFSLHLFAYLASWGMLRGSSFLLQKDYLFHNDIVKEILDEKYDSLLEVNPLSLDSTKLDLLFSLKSTIKELYFKNTKIYKGQPNGGKSATDTLITKIILGTLGCVPAYDRYFIDGLKEEGWC